MYNDKYNSNNMNAEAWFSMAGNLLFPGGVVSMTAEAADRLLNLGSGDAALLYLHLLRRGSEASPDSIPAAFHWEGGRFSAAYDALVGAGLIAPVPKTTLRPLDREEPPEYSAEDINAELANCSSSFPALVGEVQRRLGKILSTTDLKVLYTLYDYLALSAEVICLLVNWCVEEMERKYGPGRRPRMPQIRREAFVWHRLGINTAEAAEAYLRRRVELQGREAAVMALLGVRDRAPVEAERKYISAWTDLGFSNEALTMAYERTVLKKQSMNWAYMNSILLSWHQKGLHTPAEISAGDSAFRRSGASAPSAVPGQSAGVTEDIRWMKDFLSKQKSDGKEGD